MMNLGPYVELFRQMLPYFQFINQTYHYSLALFQTSILITIYKKVKELGGKEHWSIPAIAAFIILGIGIFFFPSIWGSFHTLMNVIIVAGEPLNHIGQTYLITVSALILLLAATVLIYVPWLSKAAWDLRNSNK